MNSITQEQAKGLKPGQYVMLHGIDRAMVLGVRSNGVIVSYWGRGLKEGRSLTRRVAARHLELL